MNISLYDGNSSIRPITPDEAIQERRNVPSEVIDVFNRLIVENMRQGQSTFTMESAWSKISERLHMGRDTVLRNGYLDVEPIYEQSGWKVSFDKPGYCEDYPSTYTFKKRK
jgi:hypothetical protein